MAITDERTFGGQTQVGLPVVLVRPPDPGALAQWRGYGWLAELDPAVVAEQHETLCELLRGAGAEVVYAAGDAGDDTDAVYVFDPVIVSDRGLLAGRGISIVEVPEEEFGSMGPNVLALAPLVAVAVDGSPQTRRRMEAAGVDVSVRKLRDRAQGRGRTYLPHQAAAPGVTRTAL